MSVESIIMMGIWAFFVMFAGLFLVAIALGVDRQ
jgi:hypothetical protein